MEIPKRYQHLQSHAPDKPIGFGYKTVWYAVKCYDNELVAEALFDEEYKSCDWVEGTIRAYTRQGIFVLPVIKGWVLVHGLALPQPDQYVYFQTTENFLNKLSARFGEAQFFASHRVVGLYCWARSRDGYLSRLYMMMEGEETMTGMPSTIEENLGYGEEEVLKVAEAWSINPSNLASFTNLAASGFYGSL